MDDDLLASDAAPGPLGGYAGEARPRRLRGYLAGALAVAAASLASSAVLGLFDSSNLVMLFLLAVLFVATRYGRGPSIFAAVASVAVFDFFFVPPHLTFAVADTQYLVTFLVMLVVGILVSTLAARAREAAQLAIRREQRTRALYALSRELAGSRSVEDVARTGARHVAAIFGGPAVVFLPSAAGELATLGDPLPEFARDPAERERARRALEAGAPPGRDEAPEGLAIQEPLVGHRDRLGMLAVQVPAAERPLSRELRELLAALAHQIAAPLERARVGAEAETARLAAESERLRSTLLSSVSHDLRTPLAAITGAASGLLEQPPPAASLARELASTVLEESERLDQLVGNLLDMTRLEAGTLAPRSDWHSPEEVIGSAAARVERLSGAQALDVSVSSDLPLLRLDAVLFEQAIVNLLENAFRHGGPGRASVRAWREGASAVVEVSDEGAGFKPQDAERLFEKFFRASPAPGAGLGLAIVRAIVTAHGGTIHARPGQPRGARFVIALPLTEAPPLPPAEEPA